MAKKQISAKQVGKNIIVIVDDVKHSKAIATPEERKDILSRVEQYNTKNNATLLKGIIKDLTTVKEVKKEVKPKTSLKKKEIKAKPEAVKKVEEKKVEPKVQPTYTRRSGEY